MISNTNFNLYKTFLLVYLHRSMTRASEYLLTSPSAVSHAIKELENQLNDVKLFNKLGRGVEPTREAVEFYEIIKPAFDDIAFGESVMMDFNSRTNKVKVGSQSHISGFILQDFYRDFHHKYPNIKVDIICMPKKDLRVLLIERKIDLIIDITSISDPKNSYDIIELKQIPNTLFASKRFLKSRNLSNTMTKEQIKRLPFVLHGKQFNMIKDLCRAIDYDVQPIYTTTNTKLTYSMVLQDLGIGYCMVDFLKDNYRINEIEKINIVGVEYPKSMLACAVYKNGMSKSTKTFVNGLVASLQQGSELSQVLQKRELEVKPAVG